MTFPVTRQSVVRDLASTDPAARAAAYDALARSYWRPVYLYIRLRTGRAADDAQDLTQEFFARASNASTWSATTRRRRDSGPSSAPVSTASSPTNGRRSPG
jgi:DNA-directed RNA polymerase specialized sigma24 family protein